MKIFIKLPNGVVYEIHDKSAIHDASELGLSAALVFKGAKDTDADILNLTSAKVGDVWLSKASNVEFICIEDIDGVANASAWEMLGNLHDAASTTHTHAVTVTGTNEASTVTGQVAVPTISATTSYLNVSAEAPTVNEEKDRVLGQDTTFTVSGGAASNTNVKATASGTEIAGNGSADAITGFAAHSTAAAAASLTTETVKVVAANGTVPSLGMTVSEGVLNVTWSAGAMPTLKEDQVVATGIGTTVDAITALGAPTTERVLTGVTVTKQPTISLATGATAGAGVISVTTGISDISVAADTNDAIEAVKSVSVNAPKVSLSESTSATTNTVKFVKDATVGSTDVNIKNGSAAGQKWTQTTGTTGEPRD